MATDYQIPPNNDDKRALDALRFNEKQRLVKAPQKLGENPTQEEIVERLNALIALFRGD